MQNSFLPEIEGLGRKVWRDEKRERLKIDGMKRYLESGDEAEMIE